MCGIVGLFYFDPSRPVHVSVVDRMRAVVRHRGPDDQGLYTEANVGLGFNRLSILDLTGGHQPMANESGTVWVVFNGEIYNFAELREELAGRGYRFRTRSDTETIVHAWEEYGEECVTKLRGMFAFVIWDTRRKVLFGARDRLGIKPFYYYMDTEQFAFASEMKVFCETPGFTPEVEPQALREFLHHRYVIAPRTMLRGVRKLLPGHTIRVQATGVEVRRYWDVPLEPVGKVSESQSLEDLGSLAEESIRLHIVSDVPLGAFLSGGVDSSGVVALMREVGVNDIKTFSVGYDSKESELSWARVVADHLATEHHELLLAPSAFPDLLSQIVWHLDEPVGDEASVPLYYLSRFAREKVTVALSGEGADEIFGGYPIYRIMLAIDALNRLPFVGSGGSFLAGRMDDGKLKKYLGMLGKTLERRYGGVSTVFSQEQVLRVFPAARDDGSADAVARAYRNTKEFASLVRMSYVDVKTWLADDLLVKADRMSMAASLELRVPLLDHKLVEFAMRLPPGLKIRGNAGKYLWKRYLQRFLPHNIIHRPKRGFTVPTKSWFRSDLAGFTRETLLGTGGAVEAFFCRSEVERLLRDHQVRDCGAQIFSLLVFDQWFRQFVRQSVPRAATHGLPACGERAQKV